MPRLWTCVALGAYLLARASAQVTDDVVTSAEYYYDYDEVDEPPEPARAPTPSPLSPLEPPVTPPAPNPPSLLHRPCRMSSRGGRRVKFVHSPQGRFDEYLSVGCMERTASVPRNCARSARNSFPC